MPSAAVSSHPEGAGPLLDVEGFRADDLLEEYVRQLIEAHSQVPEVTIAWQGGEPTMMGVEFFRRSVELVEHVADRVGVVRPRRDRRWPA